MIHIPILLIILIIGAIAILAMRRTKVALPAHLRWRGRALCAGFVLAALVAVGVGTWRCAGVELDPPKVPVSLPSHAPRPLPGGTKPNGKVDLGTTKLIATVLLVRKVQDQFLPLCGESRSLVWPSEAGSLLRFSGESGGARYTVLLRLDEFRNWEDRDGEDVRPTHAVLAKTKRGGAPGMIGSFGMAGLDRARVYGFGLESTGWDAPLSIIPTGTPPDLRLLIHLTRADQDDPLRQVPATQWLGGDSKPLGFVDYDDHASGPEWGSLLDRAYPSPGFRRLALLMPSALLLLLAAIVGSAGFSRGRRAIAFTALLISMGLYFCGLDALILERRARIAADADQPEIVRAIALERMGAGTVFLTGKAAARLRQIAEDPATPAHLRTRATALEKK